MDAKITWTYGENKCQRYFDTYVDGHYLCCFANNWQPNIWMGLIDSQMLHDKTLNDRQRKKQGLEKGCPFHLLHCDYILCGDNPEYIQRKIEYAFKHNKFEISH